MAATEHVEHVEHVEPAGGQGHDAEHEHPTEKKYWIIALILGAITAVEVAISYIDLGNAGAPLLLIGMAMKFFIVASYFMHLKFDSKVTRRLFISGLSLAVFCYMGVFMSFRQLGPRHHRQDINLIQSGVPQR